MVNFVNHGVTYNMENIWEYLEKYFWGRMDRHSMIMNRVFDSKDGPGGMTFEELRDMHIHRTKLESISKK